MWFKVKHRKPDKMKKNIGSNEACKEVSYSRTYEKELLLARSCWGDRGLEHLSILLDDRQCRIRTLLQTLVEH